jgi:hypothetical protein
MISIEIDWMLKNRQFVLNPAFELNLIEKYKNQTDNTIFEICC